MQVKNIIKTVIQVAQKYREKLENKNVLFIYLNRYNQEIKYIETKFLSRNFLHLTGLNFLNKYPNYFYKLCINNKLKSENIQVSNKKVIQMKLEVLNNLIAIDKKSKIIGNFNNSKLKLNTEIIVGNINWCLGFVKEDDYYVPNTLFKEDIRNVVESANRIICIMTKKIKDDKYVSIDYLAKDFEIEKIIFSKDLENKIDLKYNKNLPKKPY